MRESTQAGNDSGIGRAKLLHYVALPFELGNLLRNRSTKTVISQMVGNRSKSLQLSCLVVICCLTMLLGGCADFTAGPAPLDRTVDPALVQTHSRAGKVYCARGYLGVFSIGMMQLADRIDTKEGIVAVSTADLEYGRLQAWLIEQNKKGNLNEPLVLLGHSYGADDMIRVSQRLEKENMGVDLLILIDPVTPPPVPANVKRTYCVYFSRPATDWVPAWRGVPATLEKNNKVTQLENLDLRGAKVDFPTDNIPHQYIDKNEGVQNLCIAEIKKVCPPRTVWLQTHPVSPVVTTQPSGNSGASPRTQ